jgi:hypothetical protein
MNGNSRRGHPDFRCWKILCEEYFPMDANAFQQLDCQQWKHQLLNYSFP